MKYDSAKKKDWVTPEIETAPVRITEGGRFDFVFETRRLLNDDIFDKPDNAS
jgi:hypothetical protein